MVVFIRKTVCDNSIRADGDALWMSGFDRVVICDTMRKNKG